MLPIERGQCVYAVIHEDIFIFLANNIQNSIKVGEVVENSPQTHKQVQVTGAQHDIQPLGCLTNYMRMKRDRYGHTDEFTLRDYEMIPRHYFF